MQSTWLKCALGAAVIGTTAWAIGPNPFTHNLGLFELDGNALREGPDDDWDNVVGTSCYAVQDDTIGRKYRA